MQYNDRVKVNPSVVLREEFDDWAILFNPDSGYIFSLNPMGVYIWKCFDGNHTIRDILENLRKECENMPDDAEIHLKDFINDLIEKGLAGYKE
jgi:SynChlorMet cassette protein ScmD